MDNATLVREFESFSFRAGWLQGQLFEALVVLRSARAVTPKSHTRLIGDIDHRISCIERTLALIDRADGRSSAAVGDRDPAPANPVGA